MDPLTHTLAALMISRSGPRRLSPPSTLALLLGANIADLDYLYVLGGAAAFYKNHYGWTHSPLGSLLLAVVTALGVQRLARKKTPSTVTAIRPLVAAAGVGAGSHLLLDSTTPSGVQLFWPLRSTQMVLDWFSNDVWLLLFLLAGLALPALLRLIAEEIGARRDDRGNRRAARATLAACLLLAGARASLHSEAVTRLESHVPQGRTPLRSAALPSPLNPFRWEGIVETPVTYEMAEVNLAGTGPAPEAFSTVYKPTQAPAVEAALATPAARLYLSRARFPQVELLPAAGEGWVVRIHDLVVARWRAGARQFRVQIELDRRLSVGRAVLYYGQAEDEAP